MGQWFFPRLFFTLVSTTLSFVAASNAAVQAGEATPAATQTPAATAPQAVVTRTPSARSLDRIWWNQPAFVKGLDLTDEQRAKMDALLLRALDAERAAQASLEAKRASFEAALAKGDWQAARNAAAEVNDGVAHALAIQSGLTIDVLSLFNPQQRENFISKYPPLLRRPWMLMMGGRGGRIRNPRSRFDK
jgi:Spy/CpxP family protein refolding chaperone